jgi:hypothetical protein
MAARTGSFGRVRPDVERGEEAGAEPAQDALTSEGIVTLTSNGRHQVRFKAAHGWEVAGALHLDAISSQSILDDRVRRHSAEWHAAVQGSHHHNTAASKMRYRPRRSLRMPDGVTPPEGQFGRKRAQSFSHTGDSVGRAPGSVGANCLLQLRQQPQESHFLCRGRSNAI